MENLKENEVLVICSGQLIRRQVNKLPVGHHGLNWNCHYSQEFDKSKVKTIYTPGLSVRTVIKNEVEAFGLKFTGDVNKADIIVFDNNFYRGYPMMMYDVYLTLDELKTVLESILSHKDFDVVDDAWANATLAYLSRPDFAKLLQSCEDVMEKLSGDSKVILWNSNCSRYSCSSNKITKGVDFVRFTSASEYISSPMDEVLCFAKKLGVKVPGFKNITHDTTTLNSFSVDSSRTDVSYMLQEGLKHNMMAKPNVFVNEFLDAFKCNVFECDDDFIERLKIFDDRSSDEGTKIILAKMALSINFDTEDKNYLANLYYMVFRYASDITYTLDRYQKRYGEKFRILLKNHELNYVSDNARLYSELCDKAGIIPVQSVIDDAFNEVLYDAASLINYRMSNMFKKNSAAFKKRFGNMTVNDLLKLHEEEEKKRLAEYNN